MLKNIIVLKDGTEISSGNHEGAAIMSYSFTEMTNSGAELTLGSACSSMLEVSVYSPRGSFSLPAGTEFEYWCEENGVRTRIGFFTSESPKRSSQNIIKITAYDRMTWFDEDITEWLLNLDYSGLTLYALTKALCDLFGVVLANDSIPNGDYIIPALSFEMTGRQLLEFIGQVAGRFARIDSEGQLEFAWYGYPKNLGTQIGPSSSTTAVIVLPAGERVQTSDSETYSITVDRIPYLLGSLSYEDYTVQKIEKVHARQSEEVVGVVYPDIVGNTYLIEGNPLLKDEAVDKLRPVVRTIYESAQIEYTPAKFSVPACLSIRAGDIVRVTDVNGVIFHTIAMKCQRKGQKLTVESTGSQNRGSTTAVNNLELKDINGKVLKIKASVDGLNIKAIGLEKAQSELKQTIEGFKFEVKDNQGESATLVLKSGSAELAAATIAMLGLVSFEALKTAGKTVINGSNITTGAILADLIKAGVIKSKDGESLIIDLDAGTAVLTGGLTTIPDEQNAAGIFSAMLQNYIAIKETDGESISDIIKFWADKNGAYIRAGKSYGMQFSFSSSEQNTDFFSMGVGDGTKGFSISGDTKLINMSLNDGVGAIIFSVNNGTAKISGLSTPTEDSDVVNKKYVDDLVSKYLGG